MTSLSKFRQFSEIADRQADQHETGKSAATALPESLVWMTTSSRQARKQRN